jgi:hypothetical protein
MAAMASNVPAISGSIAFMIPSKLNESIGGSLTSFILASSRIAGTLRFESDLDAFE